MGSAAIDLTKAPGVGNGLSRHKQSVKPTTDYTPLAKVIRGPWNEAQQIRNFFASLNNYNVFWNRVRLQLESEAKAGKYDWLTTDNVGEYADFVDPRVRLTPEQKRAWLRTKSNGHLLDLIYQQFSALKNKTDDDWHKISKRVYRLNPEPVFADKSGKLVFTQRTPHPQSPLDEWRTVKATINADSNNVEFTSKFGSFYYSKYTDGIAQGGGGGGVFNYVGIPYVTDPVPTAIMPTLPSGGDTVVWPYDPITIQTPAWVDGDNQYYIDPSAGNADDANNGGRGSPSEPRETIPNMSLGGLGSWTLSAGVQLFIVGGNSFGGVNDLNTINITGTSSEPVWVIGVGETKPLLNIRRFFVDDSSFVMWDNIHFGSTNEFRTQLSGINNFCWRNCLFTGGGTVSGGSRRLVNFTGNETQINDANVVYNCELRDIGLWNPGTSETDCLGVHVQSYTRHTWIIDCHIYHVQGDSVMTGNSNYWDFNHARRSHYTYIAGCEMNENYENAYDCKDSYHTFVSENYIHDFSTTGAEPSANSTSIIMGQDSEGFLSGYVWILNNRIENAGTGIRCSATSDTFRGFVLNNTLNGCGTAMVFEPRAHTHDATTTEAEYTGAINNTIVACGTGLSTVRGSSGVEIDFEQNILLDCTGEYDVWFEDYGNSRTYANNIVYRSAEAENVRLDGTLVTNNNTEGTDPDLVDFVPQAGSLAIDYVSGGEHAAYTEFQGLYGINIRRDRLGTVRPQNSVYDCGAVEVSP